MRDLIRNYKRILSGKNKDDSDTESTDCQPLTSSCTSLSSFGTFSGSGLFKQESSMSIENLDEHGNTLGTIDSNFKSGELKKKQMYQRSGIFPPNFDTIEPDVFTVEENVLDNHVGYVKTKGVITDNNTKNDQKKSDMLDEFNDSDDFGPFPDFMEEPKPTNHSVITIFAVWNTTMGSSLLAMAWGLQKSGLIPGIIINIAIAGLCLYTAYILLEVNRKHGIAGENFEVCDLCKMLLGRWAEILAKIFSIVVLLGANIVYWILMSNFLYNSVSFLYVMLFSPGGVVDQNSTVICPRELSFNVTGEKTYLGQSNGSLFEKYWDPYSTVPLFLAIIMFPMLNFKSATFFTKFNSLGTISVGYLIVFVAIKAGVWGINMADWRVEFEVKPTVGALSGMLSLSYFIHNIIISIVRNNRHQRHNGRDLSIAFGLITFTYLFLGVVFYTTFPLAKTCIEDNILNNFSQSDVLSLAARILLLFQLFTVFPLICFMLRNDILMNLNGIFKDSGCGGFSYGKVTLLNGVVLVICIMFACFMPRIGTLIRYTGAMSGMVYVFMLPSLLKIASLKKEGNLTGSKLLIYAFIITLGTANLLSQFFIVE